LLDAECPKVPLHVSGKDLNGFIGTHICTYNMAFEDERIFFFLCFHLLPLGWHVTVWTLNPQISVA